MLRRFVSVLRKVSDSLSSQGSPSDFPITVSFNLYLKWRESTGVVRMEVPKRGFVDMTLPLDINIASPASFVVSELIKAIENSVERILSKRRPQPPPEREIEVETPSIEDEVKIPPPESRRGQQITSEETKLNWTIERAEGKVSITVDKEKVASFEGLRVESDIKDENDFDRVEGFMKNEWVDVKERLKNILSNFPVTVAERKLKSDSQAKSVSVELPLELQLSVENVPLDMLAEEVKRKVEGEIDKILKEGKKEDEQNLQKR